MQAISVAVIVILWIILSLCMTSLRLLIFTSTVPGIVSGQNQQDTIIWKNKAHGAWLSLFLHPKVLSSLPASFASCSAGALDLFSTHLSSPTLLLSLLCGFLSHERHSTQLLYLEMWHGGSNENVLHRLVDLNTWTLGGGGIRRGYGTFRLWCLVGLKYITGVDFWEFTGSPHL